MNQVKLLNYTNIRTFNDFIDAELNKLILPTNQNLTNGDLDVICENIEYIFREAIQRYVPTVVIKNSIYQISSQSRTLVRSIKNKRRHIYRLNNQNLVRSDDIKLLKNEIKLLKISLKNSIRFDINNFVANKFVSINSNQLIHNVVKKYTGHKNKNNSGVEFFENETKIVKITDANKITETFGKNFSRNHKLSFLHNSNIEPEVIASVNEISNRNDIITFNDNITPKIADKSDLAQTNSMLLPNERKILTSAEEIIEILHKRPNKKSCGRDDMPYYLMKHFSPSIILFITILFNHLLATSYFPKSWKLAKIIPIPKPGRDRTLISNWRPISQLICLGKVYEKVLQIRLNSEMYSINPDIFQTQFGFRIGISVEHALLRIQKQINNGLNHGKCTSLISLDLRAAFDTVWHNGLIYKMNKFGFSKFLIKSVMNFLSGRSFSVEFDKHLSRVYNIDAGTPQGSVLSPTLFNFYLHDIPVDNNISTTQFADDTSLQITFKNPALAQNNINRHLDRLVKYFKKWKLVLNDDKTVVVHVVGSLKDVGSFMRKKIKNIKIKIAESTILPTNNLRLLGIWFNRNNKFISHINNRLVLANKSKFALFRILKSRLIDPMIKTYVYKQYIRPVITFGSSIWLRPAAVSSAQIKKLRSFERKILRHSSNKHRSRGSYRYCKNSDLYSHANVPRIDRHMVNNNIKIFEKIEKNAEHSFLISNSDDSLLKHKNVDHIYRLFKHNQLFENERLLLFNRSYSGNNRIVYSTDQ